MGCIEREPHEQNESITQKQNQGVICSKAKQTWNAYTRYNTVKHSLGTFTDSEAAAKAYDTKAVELFGNVDHINVFPDIGLLPSTDDNDSDEDDTSDKHDIDDNKFDECLGFEMRQVLPYLR